MTPEERLEEELESQSKLIRERDRRIKELEGALQEALRKDAEAFLNSLNKKAEGEDDA